MAHRRVKDISYDEDDRDYSDEEYYGDEGGDEGGEAAGAYGDEMSAEDKEQMRVGTINVRQGLGDDMAGFVTDAQIQESLWHYYYDVGKTVTYLKSAQLLALLHWVHEKILTSVN